MTPDLASVDVVSKRINAFLRRSQTCGHKGPLEIIDGVFDIIEVATRADQLWGLTPPLMSFLVGELDREEQLSHH